MKEFYKPTGRNGDSKESDTSLGDGTDSSGVVIPPQCQGCPYVEGVTREHAADVGLEEGRKDVVHGCVSALLQHVKYTGELQNEFDLIVDGLQADVEKNKRIITEAAQCEIDEVTADCPGAVIATEADQSAGFRGCNSPVLDEGKRTGRCVSFDRYSPEQVWQAVLALLVLRASLLPDNYDGNEEGKYATPPRWIEEARGVDEDES